MITINHPDQLAKAIHQLPSPRVLVPTMGALHEGHLALVKRAREIAGDSGAVILTLFVNPTQFDQAKDLENYPRTLEKDLTLCKEHGVDLVFTPDPAAMYFEDHSVTVTEKSLSQKLCGATRPGHFDGVCTIVLKLFHLTQAHTAVFGKKDYQQLAIIRRMVRDLNVPIHIEGVETIREASGLALSSRNTSLSSKQYADAPRIRQALLAAKSAYQQGETSAQKLLNIAQEKITQSQAGARIDYLELLSAQSLQPIDPVKSPAVMATAVFYGDVRLIDNLEF